MHQLPDSGNVDIRHLESLRGFDIKRPGNKYGGEARLSFIEKCILYTVSQFLPSLNQYNLVPRAFLVVARELRKTLVKSQEAQALFARARLCLPYNEGRKETLRPK